jgi:DNA-binding response OmpR family regulator
MATILCVSERPEEVRALEVSLREDGHEVVIVSDRFQAVETILGREFGAAILFLGASSRDIWELVPLMGRLARRLPVLTVAQEDSVETQREIRRSRVFYHLTQPIDTGELKEALREALTRRQAR